MPAVQQALSVISFSRLRGSFVSSNRKKNGYELCRPGINSMLLFLITVMDYIIKTFPAFSLLTSLLLNLPLVNGASVSFKKEITGISINLLNAGFLIQDQLITWPGNYHIPYSNPAYR